MKLIVISFIRQSKTKLQVKADDKIKKEEDCPPLQVVEYDVSDDIFCEKCGELYKSEFLKVSGFNLCNKNAVLHDLRCKKYFFSNPDR